MNSDPIIVFWIAIPFELWITTPFAHYDIATLLLIMNITILVNSGPLFQLRVATLFQT